MTLFTYLMRSRTLSIQSLDIVIFFSQLKTDLHIERYNDVQIIMKLCLFKICD